MRFSTLATGVSNPSDFRWSQMNNSKELGSGKRGGQATDPLHPIYLLGYVGRIKVKTTDIELSITVTDDKPIYHSPRRLPFTERDIVDKQIDEWIQNGVIEPCSSAYASQV
ncbi:uncharacterized protein K02A2.6-like [Trichonephila clavipes]|nr:uncharacterized protein K02A2.6-like [Trichonephila clavipes]